MLRAWLWPIDTVFVARCLWHDIGCFRACMAMYGIARVAPQILLIGASFTGVALHNRFVVVVSSNSSVKSSKVHHQSCLLES